MSKDKLVLIIHPQQAKNNIESANVLHEKGFISLSAFYAQQCVELGRKSVADK